MKAELQGDRLEDKESRLEAIMVQVRDDGGFHSGHGLGTEEEGGWIWKPFEVALVGFGDSLIVGGEK